MSTQNKTNRRSAAFKSVLVGASLVMGLTLASSPLQAASACKGLDTKACDTSASCQWVNGYERKDGRSVSSFCRAKATKRTSAKATKPNVENKNATSSK